MKIIIIGTKRRKIDEKSNEVKSTTTVARGTHLRVWFVSLRTNDIYTSERACDIPLNSDV